MMKKFNQAVRQNIFKKQHKTTVGRGTRHQQINRHIRGLPGRNRSQVGTVIKGTQNPKIKFVSTERTLVGE